jgi:RNA polymerase sigma factor (TIGR02999 family)
VFFFCFDMASSESVTIRALLARIRSNDGKAREELVSHLYDRFHQRAQRRLQLERPAHSFGATDLMHDALIRLWKSDEFAKAADGNQLFRAFSRAMRQALIDRARSRTADKRGGQSQREPLDDLLEDVRRRCKADVLSLNEALQALGEEYPRQAAVLEMRFFGGCEISESAEALRISVRTAERDSRFGLAWLRAYLSEEDAA